MPEIQKKWFEVSADELNHRMFKQKVMHDDPITQSGALLYHALDEVLKGLGVDVDEDVQLQQEAMGIKVLEMGKDFPEDCRGFTVVLAPYESPYAWVRDPVMNKDGNILCEVWMYGSETMLEFHCNVNINKVIEAANSL
jgi:hypothetical protein